MKAPILLKNILDICFIFLSLTYVVSFTIFIISIFTGIDGWPIELNGNIIHDLLPAGIFLILAEFIIGGLTLYTLYLLKKLVRNFLKGRLFTKFQIASLNLIGQLIVVITIAHGLTAILGNIILESKARIGITMDLSFGSFWFILAIGLFFIYLSKVFENARGLKKENELTV
jgi:hypothetical protein